MEADYYVSHGEMMKVSSDGDYKVVSTGALGPCIGIAIYDKISNRGYISCDVTRGQKTIENTIIKALDDFGNSEGLQVVVAGANKSLKNKGIDVDALDLLAETDWRQMIELVQKYGFNNVKYARTDKRGADREIVLDLEKRKIIVETEKNLR